jgi:hypothetical protein
MGERPLARIMIGDYTMTSTSSPSLCARAALGGRWHRLFLRNDDKGESWRPLPESGERDEVACRVGPTHAGRHDGEVFFAGTET